MTPLVSVVVTCFNYGKYVGKAIDSVLKQTYRNVEIIVVNDGSTDNTDEVMCNYLKNPKIVYIQQENQGQAVAKNMGIKRSRGEFVAFLDADDRWCVEKLEKQMVCFDNERTGVVYCRARYIDENNDSFDYEMTGTYLQPRRGAVTKWLLFDNFVQFSSSIVRKSCFERFGGFNESLEMGIDWDLWLRISTAYEFDYVDDRLFYYRMGHSGQMSKNLEERQRCSDRIMVNFLGTYPGLLSAWTIRKAYAVTYCNRGEYYRPIDRKKSSWYFIDAIGQNPAEVAAYKGLVKNLLTACGRGVS
ncbi:glycosyltransferase [Oryzomonas sagensis]|uniref:Glycosyltransferase n=2 Tax=Oryzomonas sagensis TaxID=2603857 RepID=A0ABQ6TKL0_9BACT|nr:glycosyltransferase [Oryzomonas sagensis]